VTKLTHSGQTEEQGRAAIVAEARTWIGTKYHPGGRVKGVGVDCGMLIAEVYERAGIIAHMEIPPYPADWHKHRKDEKYLGFVLSEGRFIAPGEQKPGDVAMWKFGHVRSHGGIVVEWPKIIHATFQERTTWLCDCSDDVRYPASAATFYSYW